MGEGGIAMTTSKWRLAARKIIERVIAENPDCDEKELRKRISAAYPWHPRTHHPYKCWLEEVKRALGPSKPPDLFPSDIKHHWIDLKLKDET
jgi:hypothetical protein